MKIKQISVFLENKPGRLDSITKALASSRINIRAMSIADTADFGILRLIVDQPELAYDILRKQNFTVSVTDVIGVLISDDPGGLNRVLEALGRNNINIEYMYAFIGKCDKGAIVMLRVNNTEDAITSLVQDGFTLLAEEAVYKM